MLVTDRTPAKNSFRVPRMERKLGCLPNLCEILAHCLGCGTEIMAKGTGTARLARALTIELAGNMGRIYVSREGLLAYAGACFKTHKWKSEKMCEEGLRAQNRYDMSWRWGRDLRA